MTLQDVEEKINYNLLNTGKHYTHARKGDPVALQGVEYKFKIIFQTLGNTARTQEFCSCDT